ncbi:hypothetical protein QBC39DRAFT_394496 [Podospora conica]|nr:hypothetical protein QBC39DRAFT_394496 [Schizothecium conicum]
MRELVNPDYILTDPEDLYAYSYLEYRPIIRVYYKYRIPIIPYSGSSSFEGNFSVPFGGIRPSVKVGGIIGINYSGTNIIKYVVLVDSTIIKIRRRLYKSFTGYNLNSLFIGSEGTLGLINIGSATAPRMWKELPTLFFKFSGTKAGVKENISLFILTLRKDRDKVYNRLADIIEVSKKEIDELRLFTSILGYIRDRNFYESIIYNQIYIKNIVKRALKIKGIYTSEYSIGWGLDTLGVIKSIKAAFNL